MTKNLVFQACRRRYRGFTLIEVMVTVAIVTIIAAIALPSYQRHVMKSRRSAAKSALLELASREEQFFSTNNVYTADLTQLGYANVTNNAIQVPSSSQYYYSLQITTPSTATFTATAAPQNIQGGDTCGTYQLTDTGAQTVINATDSNCW